MYFSKKYESLFILNELTALANVIIIYADFVGLFAGSFYTQTPLIVDLLCIIILVRFISHAGCNWNDITDVDFDKQVTRTKTRPIASGAITKNPHIYF